MSDMPDLSALFSMLSNNNNSDIKNTSPEDMLFSLMNSSSNDTTNNFNASSNNTSINSSGDFNMPDVETMMKLMKVMKNMNESSPSKNLLKSLKPFLNDSRKQKVDQYINLLGITRVFEIFKEMGDK